MKNFLLWLLFSTCSLAQTLPWTGNSTDAWLKQSPNALVLPKAGTYIKLSGQTNRLSISSDQLLLDGNPIGGTTIYTGDGTLPSDRFVDGDGHLMSFFGNDLFLAESASGSTLQGGTNLIAIAPAGIEFRTPSLPTATSGQILTLSGGLVDYFDVVGSSGGQTNWGLVVRDPSDGTAKNTGVTIADIITGGGPGGTNQNFANTDLTFTGSRTHDGGGNDLTLQNIANVNLYGTNSVYLSSDGSFFINSITGLGLYTPNIALNVAVPGQVLTLQPDYLVEYSDLPFPLNGVPTVAAGAGAGGSPTVALANETDSAFTLSVLAGTTPATDDDIAVITFSAAYATAPHFSLSPSNKAAANLSGSSSIWATSTTTNLTVHSNTTGLVDGTIYTFEIIVVR